jgi:hypothetical protein
MKMEPTQSSATMAIKYHTPVNNTKDYARHSEHGESLKSRTYCLTLRRFREIVLGNKEKKPHANQCAPVYLIIQHGKPMGYVPFNK